MHLLDLTETFLSATQHTFWANTRRTYHYDPQLFARALPDLEQAIALEPVRGKSALLAEDQAERGRILYRQGRYKEALRAFDRAVAAHPTEYPLAHRLRAEALLRARSRG